MLKLSKRHGSKFWTARGTYLGVKVDQSTGASDKREAEAILDKIKREIFFEKTGQGGGASSGPTFAEAVISYLEKGGERRYLEPLLRYFGDLPIKRIDQAAIVAAASALYPKCSQATRNRNVYTPISSVLKHAGITTPIKRPEPPDPRVRWLTHDEAERLINACAPHLRPLVMFLLYTGCRIGEALWLEWRCVDLNRAHVSFPKTKNGEPRGVPLHRDLIVELANLPHREGCVFRKPDGKPYEPLNGDYEQSSGGRIKTAFHAAVRRAGLTDFHPHDCRHTWATWHYAEHHDFIALQKLGG
jgi:integrase